MEHPEVLMARPQSHRNRAGYSPTQELMDMHHGMDDLTAHKHEMIKVYQRHGSNECQELLHSEEDAVTSSPVDSDAYGFNE